MDENERQGSEDQENLETQHEQEVAVEKPNNTVAVIAVVVLLGILAYGLYVFLNREPAVNPAFDEALNQQEENVDLEGEETEEGLETELEEADAASDVDADAEVDSETEEVTE